MKKMNRRGAKQGQQSTPNSLNKRDDNPQTRNRFGDSGNNGGERSK